MWSWPSFRRSDWLLCQQDTDALCHIKFLCNYTNVFNSKMLINVGDYVLLRQVHCMHTILYKPTAEAEQSRVGPSRCLQWAARRLTRRSLCSCRRKKCVNWATGKPEMPNPYCQQCPLSRACTYSFLFLSASFSLCSSPLSLRLSVYLYVCLAGCCCISTAEVGWQS